MKTRVALFAKQFAEQWLKVQFMHYVILVLILLLSGGGYLWIQAHTEIVRTVENLGYKKEALLNPYLGAQTFLDGTGLRSDSAVDIEVILNTVSNDDTVILLNKRRIHPVQAEKITRWIENGGHLIMSPSALWNAETESSGDEFIDGFGIRFHEWYSEGEDWEEDVSGEISDIIENYTDEVIPDINDSSDSGESATESVDESATENDNTDNGETGSDDETEATETCTPYNQDSPSAIAYNDTGGTISVNFRSRFHLEDSSGNALYAEELEDNTSPNHILQYPVGEGMLTVLSDQRFWKNRQISWYDHSYLLWMLANNSERIWFVYDTDSPSLLDLLWSSANYLIICLGIYLGLLLWQQGRRFGPVIPDQSFDRRQLIEHIEASTRFSWRHKQFENTMAILLTDIRQHLRLSHNIVIDSLAEAHNDIDLLHNIAQIAQMDVKVVQAAFAPSFEYKEQMFVQRIKQLQQLRNQL